MIGESGSDADASQPALRLHQGGQWRELAPGAPFELIAGANGDAAGARIAIAASRAGVARLTVALLAAGGEAEVAMVEASVECVEALQAAVQLLGTPDAIALASKAAAAAARGAPSVVVGQPLNLLATVTPGPHSEALSILGSRVEAADGWVVQGGSPLGEGEGATAGAGGEALAQGEARTEVVQVRPERVVAPAASVGSMVVAWEHAAEGARGETRLALPAALASAAALSLSLHAPPWARAGEAFEVAVTVRNATSALQECDLVVTDAVGVVFSGEKKGTLAVLPRSSAAVKYHAVATVTGEVELPVVAVACKALGGEARHSRRLQILPPAAAR